MAERIWNHNEWVDPETGYTCVTRHSDWWCGYVVLPSEHPLSGVHYDEAEWPRDIEVHGGITLAGKLGSFDGWTVGFDCAHWGDGEWNYNENDSGYTQAAHIDEEYVREEIRKLAEQLKAWE